MPDPISNPGTPSIQPTPPYSSDKPMLGAGEETQPRPFSLPPEPLKKEPQPGSVEGKPSPMEVAKDAERQGQKPLSYQELNEQLDKFNNHLEDAKNRLQGPERNKLTKDHEEALQRLTDKLTPDVKTIAQTTQSPYSPPTLKKGGGVLDFVINWLDGSQSSMKSALGYLESKHDLNPADYLKLQYSVQRASQRGELFASIIGSTVSGLKTLMSTQLG